MISEGQARALLDQCETTLGRRLETLRSRLLSSDTLGALWELITLYTATKLGPEVDHEPFERQPDVRVDRQGIPRYWIEATHVQWPHCDATAHITAFIDWIGDEFEKRHNVPRTSYRIDIRTVTNRTPINIPAQHLWSDLRDTAEWKAFVAGVRDRTTKYPTVQLPTPFSALVRVTLLDSPDLYASSGYPYPDSTTSVYQHPIWAALRSKARQAQRWKLTDPIVVCVGSSRSLSLFNSAQTGGISVEDAVTAALYQQRGGRQVAGPSQRWISSAKLQPGVPGADRLSAVLLVSIEDKKDFRWFANDNLRVARTRTIVNTKARYPLTPAQRELLATLDFNTFPYGPQWETWPQPTRSDLRDSTRLLKRYNPGGMVSLSTTSDGSVVLTIPAEDLTKLLTGVGTVESIPDVLRAFPGTIHQRLALLPPLLRAEVIPGDPKQRKPDHIALTFGTPLLPVLQGSKQSSGKPSSKT